MFYIIQAMHEINTFLLSYIIYSQRNVASLILHNDLVYVWEGSN